MLSTMKRTGTGSQTGHLVRQDIARSIVGGFVGTVAITLMMYFVAPRMTGQTMDIARMLGSMLGDNWWAGMIMHFVIGTILSPLIFTVLLAERLPGVPVAKGIIWGVSLWFLAQAVVMPMVGAGFFSVHSGGKMAVMGSLMGHLVYGGLLGSIAGPPECK
jgi:Family of unknown function (DUF6789)